MILLWITLCFIDITFAAVAQSVERQSHNLKVVSSILTRGRFLFFASALLSSIYLHSILSRLVKRKFFLSLCKKKSTISEFVFLLVIIQKVDHYTQDQKKRNSTKKQRQFIISIERELFFQRENTTVDKLSFNGKKNTRKY